MDGRGGYFTHVLEERGSERYRDNFLPEELDVPETSILKKCHEKRREGSLLNLSYIHVVQSSSTN